MFGSKRFTLQRFASTRSFTLSLPFFLNSLLSVRVSHRVVFAEIRVVAGTNVAFRKPTNQSTTVRGGDASHGNDGDSSTEHDGKRCTETQSEPSPWWKVDLLKSYSVKVVRVTTRGCCGKCFFLFLTCLPSLYIESGIKWISFCEISKLALKPNTFLLQQIMLYVCAELSSEKRSVDFV